MNCLGGHSQQRAQSCSQGLLCPCPYQLLQPSLSVGGHQPPEEMLKRYPAVAGTQSLQLTWMGEEQMSCWLGAYQVTVGSTGGPEAVDPPAAPKLVCGSFCAPPEDATPSTSCPLGNLL